MINNVVSLLGRQRRLRLVVAADLQQPSPSQDTPRLVSSPMPISFAEWKGDARLAKAQPLVQITVCNVLAMIGVNPDTGATTKQEAHIELRFDLLVEGGVTLKQFKEETSEILRTILCRPVLVTQSHKSGIPFLVYTIAPKFFIIPRQP